MIPPVITVIVVIFMMLGIVLLGPVLDLGEDHHGLLPSQPDLHPCRDSSSTLRSGMSSGAGIIPNFPGGFNGTLFFFLMANIGTTIAPWMIFFQQSAVVDKQMKEKDIPWGKFDTVVGALFTIVVAVFVIIVHGYAPVRAWTSRALPRPSRPSWERTTWVGTLLAIGLFDAGFLGAICIALTSSWAFGEVFGWAHSLNYKVKEAFWFYVFFFFGLVTAGASRPYPGSPAGPDHPLRAGGRGDPAAGGARIFDHPSQQ